ncbi:hypothetical protein L228DRAFT_280563 [Xylona heveae TC161]|uniref:DUF202 domain-containing protein n=1 Tax=Xylona heveae (strain CBS 132557 / TC161) TaxID=1328760 RepID=A0A165ISA0_XYLHT|nr:hypothetical protein L228DRAFT_280563 [Xylona heveae TC161]KZF25312.1 hypothetical protein L228DRAFT_280563 [Xylona heveae TC161]
MAEPSLPKAPVTTASSGTTNTPAQEHDSLKTQTHGNELPLEHTELQPVQALTCQSRRSHSNTQTNQDHGASSASRGRTCSGLTLAVRRFWTRQIAVTVPRDACRDHLALERTFLGYLRTSLALSMIGVTITQLFRLQHALDPNPVLGYYVLGKPLGCLCLGSAIVVVLSGAFRCWRQQNAMVRRKILVGGWELKLIGTLTALILLCVFVVLVAVDVSKLGKH